MTRGRTPRPVNTTFGEGQRGGEPLDVEFGGRHGQREKGDDSREPRQGASRYRQPDEPPARRRATKKK
jgi:hypothetical protein